MKKIDSRYKLLWILGTVLALGFLGGSAVNYQITKSSVHQQIVQNDLPLTMNNIYSDLTSELTRPILVSSSMAADTFLKDWVIDGEQDTERVQKYLLEIKEKYNFFTTFFISSLSSRYYHFKGVHKTISPVDSHDVWYYRFIATAKEYALDVDTDEASSNILTVFINYRVEDNEGRLLGVAGVGLKMESVARLVEDYKERYGRSVFLTDRDGMIQVHQDFSLIETTKISDLEGLAHLSSEILAITGQPESFEYLRDGDRILLNVRDIDSLNWLLFVEQSEAEALHNARMTFLRTIIIGLLTSVVIFSITLITINRYQRRLEKLITSDELTGVANRRKLEEEFTRFSYRHSRTGEPFCLILSDLDGFKKVNDTLGHVHGDTVLRTIVDRVAHVVRPTDVLARWGGDEFAILTESSLSEAMLMAERVRNAVNQIEWAVPGTNILDDPRSAVTISLGVAAFKKGEDFSRLLLRADYVLYQCKGQGGNRAEQSD